MLDTENDEKIDFLLMEINQLLERLEKNQLTEEEKIVLDQYCQEFFGYIDNLKKEKDESEKRLIELSNLKKAHTAYTRSD